MISNDQAYVESFCTLVRGFCAWAEGPAGSPDEDRSQAIKYLARLYLGAIELPEVETGGTFEDEPISLDDYWRVSRRFNSLPFQYFFTISQPVTETPEKPVQPVVGDICDDLADIYRALKDGLHLYDKGRIKDALFYWREGFSYYWGRYATSALHALHCYETKDEAHRHGGQSS